MWIADNWKEYEVIDCSNGEKLERWADYLLVRPDPQVIWNTPQKHPGWRKKNGHYHRSKKGGGEWEFSLRRSHFPPEAFQLQTYRIISRTSSKLGLVRQKDTSGKTSG